jgi:beta-glucosidase
MFSTWYTIGPESLSWAPKFARSRWNSSAISITENDRATNDAVADDGNVYDAGRMMFPRTHLTRLQRVAAKGVPVKRYFPCSAMDNFEWVNGRGDRFGLVYGCCARRSR